MTAPQPNPGSDEAASSEPLSTQQVAGILEPAPCPLCGGPSTLACNDGQSFWWVECDEFSCGCESGGNSARGEAIAAWNRRSESAELLRLREANTDLLHALGDMICLTAVREAAKSVAPLWLKHADEVAIRAAALASHGTGEGE